MKEFLNGCENTINQALEHIKFMEEIFQLKETEKNTFMEHYYELIDYFNQSLKNVEKTVKEIAKDFPRANDLLHILDDLFNDLKLIHKIVHKKF